ncbi:hypothetical protein CRG98_004266 [Punica granatum]|uniref:Uncharacterized protein n=1 Tax=Punica granatum TaxID=22663 RepID=A0A2I0L3X2_PUNGR|nr:hypothetical protein CRG98_004266 [Punica granatum]
MDLGFVPRSLLLRGSFAPALFKALTNRLWANLPLHLDRQALRVSNDDLAKIVDTSDEWISIRTGIRN